MSVENTLTVRYTSTVSMAQASFKIAPLERGKFETWALLVEAVMRKAGTWKHVLGEAPKPRITKKDDPEEIAALARWEQNESDAWSDLIVAIGENEASLVYGLTTAKEVWEKIKKEFGSTGTVKKAGLLKKIAAHRLTDSDDVKKYLKEFFEAVGKLKMLKIDIHSDLQAVLLLLSLPPSLDNFRCAIESRDDLPTPQDLKVKILEELEVRDSRSKEEGEAEAMLAFRRQRGGYSQGFRGGGQHGDHDNAAGSAESTNFKWKCYRCHQTGHPAKKCPERQKKNTRNDRSRNSTAKLADGDVTEAFCASEELALRAVQNAGDGRWCLDSGCTSHMCNSQEYFTEVPSSVVNRKLQLASDAMTHVSAAGTASITVANGSSNRSVQLHDTLFVPSLRTNLLSVARIADHENATIFVKDRAVVRTMTDEVRRLMTGEGVKVLAKRSNNLYYVEESADCSNLAKVGSAASVSLWHQRCGHLNVNDLLEVTQRGYVTGITLRERESTPCDVCLRSKMTALPFPKKSEKSTSILEIVHSDVWGPARTESWGRARYFVTFIDDSSRWCEVRFLRKKSDVFQSFKEFKAQAELQSGVQLKCLMSDNGLEYTNGDFSNFCKNHGIVRRFTVPHTPEQNGVSERKNRTLVDMARCLLVQSGLSGAFWAEAVATANYLRNRCPTSSLNGHTPFEKWKGDVPDLSHLRVFGSKVFILNKDPTKGKFEPRSREGVFVGYSEEVKGYRVWVPELRKIVVGRDVKFLEDERVVSGEVRDEVGRADKADDEVFPVFPTTRSASAQSEMTSQHADRRNVTEQAEAPSQESGMQSCQDESFPTPAEPVRSELVRRDSTRSAPKLGPVRRKSVPTSQRQVSAAGDGNVVLVRGPGRPRLERTGSRGRPRKGYHTRSVSSVGDNEDNEDDLDVRELADDDEDEVFVEEVKKDVFLDAEEANLIMESANIAEVSLNEAMAGGESAEWLNAITEEIRGLIKKDTWRLVEKPADRSIVSCRIVLRNKLNPDGTLERRKARVVARGFTQRPGVDFTDTFAPVVRLDSVRLLMALAVQYGLTVYQLDIVAAYLHGKLKEEIYMQTPDYLLEALEHLASTDKDPEIRLKASKMFKLLKTGNKVCLLQKALYGLRQAGREWRDEYDAKLRQMGFEKSLNEPCMYYRVTSTEITVLVVYVDDILYMSNVPQRLVEIKNGLAHYFEVKDLGVARYCLGIEIRQQDGKISLTQSGYCRDLLEKFKMSESKPMATPADCKAKLPDGIRREKKDQREKPYRQLIGSLMYLVVGTRPDLAFTVNRLAQYNESYLDAHWSAAKRVLRYIQGTQNYGLVFKKTSSTISGYCDADYANDNFDRKSYGGYVFKLSGSAISWRSQKQRTVVLSTTEAEYVSLSEASKEAMYLRNLMEEMGLEYLMDVKLGTDNQGAKLLAENSVYHARTKHIATRYHFVRQLVADKLINIYYVPTEVMPADILTKPLPGPAHQRGLRMLGVFNC